MQALVGPRAKALLAWAVPVLFALWIHRDGLQCWFFQDDFAWLGLLRRIHGAGDVMRALFDPAAQGTIRPWSERGFFLLFEAVFGFDNLPFRIAVFLTMAANLALLVWIVKRISGSLVAGAASGVIWMANAALMTVMTWSSAFNEALCPLFLLAALALFIRYADTGRRSYWWWQVVVFSLGFGVLESNVVYPALAAAWVVFAGPEDRRRPLLRSLIPPFAISVIYFVLHRVVAPIPRAGAYSVHFDLTMLKSLALYARWSLLPADYLKFGHSIAMGRAILVVCGIAVGAASYMAWRRRLPAILFFASWFLIALAPVLPLPFHRTDYYLTIPLIGLAMLGGFCLRRWPAPTSLALCFYLAGMVPVTLAADRWALNRTEAVRTLVEGVEEAHQRHPGKLILVDGLTTDLYNDAFGHSPFFPLGIDNVYLTPGSERSVTPVPDILSIRDAVLDPSVTIRALSRDDAVIYSVSGDHLRNVTEAYERSTPNLLRNRLPDHVDAGNPLFSDLLGPEWLPSEAGFRWMPARATLRLRGPDASGGKLALDGYCPAEQLKQAPRRLWVTVDGLPAGETRIDDPESNFHRLFPLPRAAWGRDSITIELHVEPVAHRGSTEYGLVFGKLAIEP